MSTLELYSESKLPDMTTLQGRVSYKSASYLMNRNQSTIKNYQRRLPADYTGQSKADEFNIKLITNNMPMTLPE